MRFYNFQTQITPATVEAMMKALRNVNGPDAVFVSSPGGQFEFFSVLGPAIQRRGLTMLAGDVRSAATILFMLGSHRLALPDSTFFFHEVRAVVGPSLCIALTDLQELREMHRRMQAEHREHLEEWVQAVRNAQGWFLDFMRQATGLLPSIFLDLMRANATLSAAEAIRYGIVHHIVPDPEAAHHALATRFR